MLPTFLTLYHLKRKCQTCISRNGVITHYLHSTIPEPMVNVPSFCSRHTPLAFLMVFALVLTGCGGGGDGEDEASVQIRQGERSPAIEGASANIVSPEAEAVIGEDVEAIIEAENFEPGEQTDTERANEISNSENGQHFHLILDNEPYMANYEAGTPFDLSTLDSGAHTLIAFPSRSYHESVKGEDAYDLVNFYVAEESGSFPLREDEPAIIYSRPKGEYTGADAEQIMLDFYLHNVELSEDGHKARYTIHEEGEEDSELASITLTEWAPAFVTGLESGTYVVRLQLLDEEDTVVPGTFNDTQREITVQLESDM